MTPTVRTTLLVAVPPLLVAVGGIVLLATVAPETVALHWGANGVDRVGGSAELIAVLAVLVPVFTATMVAAALVALRNGTTRGYLRVLVGVSTGFAVMITGGLVGSTLSQGSAVDVASLPVSTALVPLLLAAAAGAAIGLLLSTLAPAVPAPAASGIPVVPLPLAQSEVAYWSARVLSPPAVIALVIAAIVVVDVICVVAGLPIWLPVIYSLVLIVLGSLLGWHVVVDREGLRATGLLGFPVVRARPQEITGVGVDTIRALRDFGGWGFRVDSQGRWGVIVRSGSAIQVDRVGTSPLVITVDDAENGAALLAALAVRQR